MAVTLFPTLSETFDGTNKCFICNETFHYEKCELLGLQDGNCIFPASTKVNTKYFSKLSEFSIITDFLAWTDFSTVLNRQIQWEKEGVLPLDLAFITCFVFQYLFPEFCLQMIV